MLLVEEVACASEAATDPKTREPLTSLQRPHHQMPAHSKTHPCPPNTVHSLQSHTEIFTASSLRVTEPHLVLHPNPSRALLWHKHLILKQTCAGSPMLMLSPPPPVTPALPCSSSSSSSSNPWGRLPATESLDTAAPRRLAVSLWSGPLSLFAHALPPYVHHRIIFSFVFSTFSICVSVLLQLQALTRHLSPGALPVLYEPALVKFYCAAASALTETILMQKNPLRSALDPSWPSPICKSL